jgi:hypothetical protein
LAHLTHRELDCKSMSQRSDGKGGAGYPALANQTQDFQILGPWALRPMLHVVAVVLVWHHRGGDLLRGGDNRTRQRVGRGLSGRSQTLCIPRHYKRPCWAPIWAKAPKERNSGRYWGQSRAKEVPIPVWGENNTGKISG